MILQVLAHARQMVRDGNAELLQPLAVADAGAFQDRRRIDRARREDHLALGQQRCSAPPRRISTPVAMRPATSTRSTWACVISVRFLRDSAGFRNALAALQRRPRFWLTWK